MSPSLHVRDIKTPNGSSASFAKERVPKYWANHRGRPEQGLGEDFGETAVD